MSSRVGALIAVLAVVAAGCSLSPADEPPAGAPMWVNAWGAAPAALMPAGCGSERAVFHRVESRTLRLVVRSSVDGRAVRLRLSNRLSREPLTLSHVTVARAATGAAVEAPTIRDVLFAGQRSTVIPAGAELVSDSVVTDVSTDRGLTVSITTVNSGRLTWHPVGAPTTYTTSAGSSDRAADARSTPFRTRLNSYPILAGIDVRSDRAVGSIVALGDSLTDGGNAPETGWAGILAKRLRAARRPFAVANAGITCNALLSGNGMIGPRAADRFTADVLDRAGVSHVVIFLGTNDLAGRPTAATLIAAITELAEHAHARDIRVIGATIIPSNGSPATRTATRQAVNRWIKTTRLLDGFIDFDAVIRSNSDPTRMTPGYRGDDVHPNRRGQAAMGNGINLSLFDPTERDQ